MLHVHSIPLHWSRFRIICPRFSGGTCSGKTSVASLLGKVLPWCQVVNQDKYYHEEDSSSHVRNKVILSRLDNLNITSLMLIIQPTNLINWEVLEAFNMEKMKLDIEQIRQNVRLPVNIAFIIFRSWIMIICRHLTRKRFLLRRKIQ